MIRNFRSALLAGYDTWRWAAELALDRDRGFLDEAFADWAQAQWELLVERPLLATGEFLELYRAGSDYEQGLHSRVFFHDAAATHAVRVESRSGRQIQDTLSTALVDVETKAFDGFMSRSGDWFEEKPPFDHVLLTDQQTRRDSLLVPLYELRFHISPLVVS